MTVDAGMISFLFVIYFVFHLLGDYFFQTDYEAANKTNNWQVRAHHALGYALITFITPTAFLLMLSIISMSIIEILVYWISFIASHFVIDDRKFVLWWRRVYSGDDSTKEEIAASHIKTHVVITLDQTLHFLVILLVSILIVAL
ncbi:MAG: DUF3307 domain-containing protein [Desulfitobacteriaceae bacterium]|nr:DUF3307 domain-containing protein [Desulfitobacteriaceae bacterium]